jgi:hypothetical protein
VLITLSTESKIQESHASLSHLRNVYINSQISPISVSISLFHQHNFNAPPASQNI